MKNLLRILVVITSLASCKPEIKDNSDRFKKGIFEIPAGNGYGKTTIERIDSLQIENYEQIQSIAKDGSSSVKKDHTYRYPLYQMEK